MEDVEDELGSIEQLVFGNFSGIDDDGLGHLYGLYFL